MTQSLQPNSSARAKIWIRSLSRWFTHQGNELWKLRNTTVHENDTKTSTIHQFLNQKIQNLYTLQQEINAKDCDMFSLPIEKRFEQTEHQKSRWIEQTSATMKQCMEDHQKKMQTGQKDIRQFFQNNGNSH